MPVTGSAGSVCLMHTRLAHGSDANRSDRSRGLYICVYTAADAFPLARNPMANPNEGMIVRGRKTRKARLSEGLGRAAGAAEARLLLRGPGPKVGGRRLAWSAAA